MSIYVDNESNTSWNTAEKRHCINTLVLRPSDHGFQFDRSNLQGPHNSQEPQRSFRNRHLLNYRDFEVSRAAQHASA